MRFMNRSLLLAATILVSTLGPSRPAWSESLTIDLVQFQTSDPEAFASMRRKSDSMPFTMTEIEKLSQAGIAERSLLEMVRTRGLLVVADADTLLRLKAGGATDALVAAVSAHALPPNRTLDLTIAVRLETPYSVGQAPHLYVEIVNLDTKEQEAFLHSPLSQLLAQKWRVDVVEDRSDPLLPTRVRSLRVWGQVPIRRPGKLEIRLLVSKDPALTRLDGLSPGDQKDVRVFPIEYPPVSLSRACELQVELSRDALLRDHFNLGRTDVRCRWD